ncbi:MAG TPA: class I SAM-dependent methyltransferase [Pyrinomonadaceae bacterium]
MGLTSLYIKAKERALSLRRGYARDVFGRIHSGNLWGEAESASGVGSTLEKTEAVRRELPALLGRFDVRTLLDAPCGDFNWMSRVDLSGVEYVGADIVPELVESNRARFALDFRVLDITRDALPSSDLILCRDCLIHLSHRFCLMALANFRRSGARYLLTTHYPDAINRDILTGQWRPLNLQAPPFDFPAPLGAIDEGEGRVLALWRLT